MKLKIFLIVGALPLLLLISGCSNVSSKFCTILKHGDFKNTTAYMDGDVCVIEEDNYNMTYYIECKGTFERAYIIVKIDEEINETVELGDQCELTELNLK